MVEKAKLKNDLLVAIFEASGKFNELETLFIKIGRTLVRLYDLEETP